MTPIDRPHPLHRPHPLPGSAARGGYGYGVRREPGEQGVALLIVLLLSMVLIPFATEFAFQTDMESKTAGNVTDQLMIDNALEGQYQIMLTRIEFDGQGNETDSYTDGWNDEELLQRDEAETGVSVRTRVFDEQGKFPILKMGTGPADEQGLWKERFIALVERFREETSLDAGTIADELAEDVQRFVRGDGRGQIPKPKTLNDSPLLTLDDLNFASVLFEKHRLLEDVKEGEEIALGLHRYLTIYGNGKVNLNTAEQVLLEAFFPNDPVIAERIVERREGGSEEDETSELDEEGAGGNPFTDVNQVTELEGVNTQLLRANKVVPSRDFDVRTNVFSLRITGSTERNHRQELFVVERVPGSDPNGEIQGFRHLLCQERTDPLEDAGTTDDGF